MTRPDFSGAVASLRARLDTHRRDHPTSPVRASLVTAVKVADHVWIRRAQR